MWLLHLFWRITDLSVRTVHQHAKGAQSLALAADMRGVPVHHHTVPDSPTTSGLVPAGGERRGRVVNDEKANCLLWKFCVFIACLWAKNINTSSKLIHCVSSQLRKTHTSKEVRPLTYINIFRFFLSNAQLVSLHYYYIPCKQHSSAPLNKTFHSRQFDRLNTCN